MLFRNRPLSVYGLLLSRMIYRFSRPKSKIEKANDNIKIGLSSKERKSNQPFLFEELNELKEAYEFEVNFHNQLKAKLLNERIVTQIIRESTIAYKSIWQTLKRLNMKSYLILPKAWNISTTLYYKYGGVPWKLGDVRKNVCYLGLVYKKLDDDSQSQNACCAAQMFLDSGDGMVFKGNIGPWYNPVSKEFHINKKDAAELLSMSLEAFRSKSETKRNILMKFLFMPKPILMTMNGKVSARRLKVKVKWLAFVLGMTAVSNYTVIFLTVYQGVLPYYTPSRLAYLWTKGYIPRLQTQIGLETPNPLDSRNYKGEHNIKTVCEDILALSKLNYNTCVFADGSPVTLKFADSIGEVLTAGKNIKSEVLFRLEIMFKRINRWVFHSKCSYDIP